jgi:uncharacterized protein YecE (DUF72 family)
MILVGTSGFSYEDWVGPFYPEGTKRADMLAVYASRFPLVELDFTYYQMPGLKTMQGLARKTPPRFQFAVKANKQMTHEPGLSVTDRQIICHHFSYSLAPLKDEAKLACILLQFPQSFHCNQANLDFLNNFAEWLPETPLVVEFRHKSWVNEAAFSFLKERKLNFCSVDEPDLPGLFPPIAVTTGDLAYVRFHGRNKEKWWNHQTVGERYDYLYSDTELGEWLPKLRTMGTESRTLMVLFNNCHFGQAARNALKMQQLLFED